MKSKTEVHEAPGRDGRGPLGEEAQRLFRQGRARLEEGLDAEALDCLQKAAQLAPDHVQLRSWLGVAVARAEHDFEQSRAMCESAAKQEFFNPDLYLNVSFVYMEFGRRAEALRYLRRGQMIDPGHAEIRQEISRLGNRRLPIVPFLPRRHPLNRALGSARKFVMSPFLGR
jgi:Flp pilus assembly protein TadD